MQTEMPFVSYKWPISEVPADKRSIYLLSTHLIECAGMLFVLRPNLAG